MMDSVECHCLPGCPIDSTAGRDELDFGAWGKERVEAIFAASKVRPNDRAVRYRVPTAGLTRPSAAKVSVAAKQMDRLLDVLTAEKALMVTGAVTLLVSALSYVSGELILAIVFATFAIVCAGLSYSRRLAAADGGA